MLKGKSVDAGVGPQSYEATITQSATLERADVSGMVPWFCSEQMATYFGTCGTRTSADCARARCILAACLAKNSCERRALPFGVFTEV